MPTQEIRDLHRRFENIGSIIAWLQTTELMLRWWLTKAGKHDIVIPSYVGQVMAKSPMTDYRTLGQLIGAYNSQLSAEEGNYLLDVAIVTLRDALAHGRILAELNDKVPTLYQFSKLENGKVTVLAKKTLTPEMLTSDMDFLRDQFFRLDECGKRRGYFTVQTIQSGDR
jgi:hypothetical protein